MSGHKMLFAIGYIIKLREIAPSTRLFEKPYKHSKKNLWQTLTIEYDGVNISLLVSSGLLEPQTAPRGM